MQISNLRPHGTGLIFDVQITPEIRLIRWVAKRDSAGRQKIYPPTLREGPVGTIATPAFLSSLAQLVEQAYKEGDLPNDNHSA